MCVVNLESVNKLDLTWKQSFLILRMLNQLKSNITNVESVEKRYWNLKIKMISISVLNQYFFKKCQLCIESYLIDIELISNHILSVSCIDFSISPILGWFNLLFHQLVISSTHCFINSLFHQLIVSSTSCFINSLFCQLVVSSTCCFVNLLFYKLVSSTFPFIDSSIHHR